MTLLAAAIAKPPSEREPWLSSACDGNEQLYREAIELIREEEEMGSFLMHPMIALNEFPHPFQVGQIVAERFEITREIGEGGMGIVYESFDLKRNLRIAIKAAKPGFQRLLSPELEGALTVRHANVCRVNEIHTARTDQGEVDFLTMELLEGTTLSAHLESRGRLAEPEALMIARQLCAGLAEAHRSGVIHRDLKSANVILCQTADGASRAIITDFGLAGGSRDSEELAGTPVYMAPELWLGEPASKASDIYALGAILYEMVADPGLKSLRDAESIHPDTSCLSRSWASTIDRCLASSPGARPKETAEVLAGLDRRSFPRTLLVALFLLASLCAVWFWRRQPVKTLTSKDAIVIADFSNTTGEAVFDDTLKQGLAADLQQSDFLNILSDKEVAEQLGFMGRSVDQRLSRPIAQEVCLRSGSKAMLLGSIARLGGHYALGLKAVNCQSGETLGEAQVEADRQEDVLTKLHQAANQIRQTLGESLASIKAFNFPMDATTPSLEALKALSKAASMPNEAEAMPYYQKAIELDPNFPLAHLELGLLYSNRGETELAAENVRKAYAGLNSVSEKERFLITSTYYSLVTGDLEKEAQTYQLWIQSYPKDRRPYVNLVSCYLTLGRYGEALPVADQALRMEPESAMSYYLLAREYLGLNRIEDAKRILDHAVTKKLDGAYLHLGFYHVAFLRDDAQQMERELEWGRDKPGDLDMLLSAQADTEAFHGRLRRAREFSQQAVSTALHADSKESAALWKANEALQDAEFENSTTAIRDANAALRLSAEQDVKIIAALAIARAGDGSRANVLAKQLEKNTDTDTVLKKYWLPTIHAAIELAYGKSARALDTLEVTAPYELGATSSSYGNLYPVFLRGEAYLLKRNGPAAAKEFQKFADHRGIVLNSPLAALAELQLARAQALSGDYSGAKANYRTFLELWADADSTLPIVKRARTEYYRLPEAKQ